MSSRVDLPSTKNKDWYVFLEIRLVNCSSLSAVNYREVEMCSFIRYFARACSGGFTHLYSGWFIFGKYMLDGHLYIKYSISLENFKILCIICKTPYTMPLDNTHYTKIFNKKTFKINVTLFLHPSQCGLFWCLKRVESNLPPHTFIPASTGRSMATHG